MVAATVLAGAVAGTEAAGAVAGTVAAQREEWAKSREIIYEPSSLVLPESTLFPDRGSYPAGPLS